MAHPAQFSQMYLDYLRMQHNQGTLGKHPNAKSRKTVITLDVLLNAPPMRSSRTIPIHPNARPKPQKFPKAPYAQANTKRSNAAPPPSSSSSEIPVNEIILAARQVLGFTKNDKLHIDGIKQRRRELAQRHHPDRGGDSEKLKDINAAADILMQHLEGAKRSKSK